MESEIQLAFFFFTIFILLVEKLVSEYIEGILDIKIEDHK